MDKAAQADLRSSGVEGKSKEWKKEEKTGSCLIICRVALILLAEAHVPMPVTLAGKKNIVIFLCKILISDYIMKY